MNFTLRQNKIINERLSFLGESFYFTEELENEKNFLCKIHLVFYKKMF